MWVCEAQTHVHQCHFSIYGSLLKWRGSSQARADCTKISSWVMSQEPVCISSNVQEIRGSSHGGWGLESSKSQSPGHLFSSDSCTNPGTYRTREKGPMQLQKTQELLNTEQFNKSWRQKTGHDAPAMDPGPSIRIFKYKTTASILLIGKTVLVWNEQIEQRWFSKGRTPKLQRVVQARVFLNRY